MLYDESVTSFKRPFCMMVAGPSQCGKTWYLKELLELKSVKMVPPPKRIIYCYKEWQEAFNELQDYNPEIEFVQGLPYELLSSIKDSDAALVILDDLMQECVDDKTIMDLFTVSSHHRNISPIFLTQNMFCQGKHARSISLNTHYLALFKNPRDRSQIRTLGLQLYPDKLKEFMECFNDSVSNAYGKLIVDLKQDTPEELRLRTTEPYTDETIVYQM